MAQEPGRAEAMEHRVPRRAIKFVLACVLSLSTWLFSSAQSTAPAQDSAPSQPQSQGESSSRGHHSGHYVQVPLEDDSEPPELTEAEAAIDKQDYFSAESLLRKFVEHDSASYVAWFDLGYVENALGKLDASIAAYRKSVDAKPSVFESNLNLGLQLAKFGKPDAEQFLRAATQLKPSSHPEEGQYRAWLSLGQVVATSNPDEALADYKKAAALQPSEAEPYISAGVLLEHQDEYPQAEAEYKHALALDPQSVDAMTCLVNLYMRARRFPEAEDYLRKLVASHPDSAEIHLQLGRVLAAEGNADTAIAEMQSGLKLAPHDDAAQRDFADICAEAGKNELAETAYRELIQVHPDSAYLHRRLGQVLLQRKKFLEAQQEFLTVLKLKPEFGEAYGDLAFAAGENKDYPLVLRSLDQRLKFLPETAITYFMRASAYDHLKDFKKAAENYRLFLKSANGQYPDQEWQAQHRLIAISPKK